MSFFTKKKRSYRYYLRKAHRYLGIIFGIQFIFWTAGGLYFSWSDIDKIHGDHLIKPQHHLSANVSLVSPEGVLHTISENEHIDSLSSIKLINILQQPVYQVRYFSGKDEKTVLADAETGTIRRPLSKEEAIRIADAYFLPDAALKNVEYLETTGSHHEYRGKPLPAWAVSYDYPGNPVLYIAAAEGTFQNIRYRNWRIFDLLWMLHTMDYSERDNFGNLLLRTFSVFALITVISGFVLYFISSRRRKKTK